MRLSVRLKSAWAVACTSVKLALIEASSVRVSPTAMPLRSLIPDMPMSMWRRTAEDPDRVSGSSFFAGQSA